MDMKELLEKLQSSVEKIKPVLFYRETKDYTYSKTFKITSTQNKKEPNEPNHKFKNPKKSDVAIDSIRVKVNANFQTKGFIQIVSDGRIILENETAGDFELSDEWIQKYDDGLLLKQDSTIDFFVWSSDGTEVKVSVNVTLGNVCNCQLN